MFEIVFSDKYVSDELFYHVIRILCVFIEKRSDMQEHIAVLCNEYNLYHLISKRNISFGDFNHYINLLDNFMTEFMRRE